MNSESRHLLLLLILTFHALSASGQPRLKRFLSRADSMLTARYYRASHDSTYIVRPEGKLTLKLRGNLSGNSLHAKGTIDGIRARTDLSTSHKATISIGAAYRGISLSYSINPAKLAGFYKDYELNFAFYSGRFCIDASYQRSLSLSGDMTVGEDAFRLERNEADMKVLNVTAYYVFNHRRYSVSAAYNQSYIQRRSAGSWLAGLSYQGGSIETSDDWKNQHPDDYTVRITVGHLGIGGGYGYNLVLGKRWLFNLTFLPTVVVYNRNKMTIDGESQHAGRMRFNMLFNERAAIVYNISPRYFAGASLVMTNSLFDDKHVIVNQNKWLARAFVGMRLWK
ncbi:MAG: DUF4421 family protein [Bacteroidaceae bacterium]|nr:DUF4421 family protein [Bacteroidaceae bacterium]